MSKMMAVAATAFFLASAAPAVALQHSDTDTSSATAAQKKLPDGTTAEERDNTARLNAAQSAPARAENVTYEQEVSAAAQQVAHDQAEFAEETAAYLAGGEWQGKAGGYAIQGAAEGLIEWIRGSHSGVMGLPLHETRALLKAAGFAIG